MKIKKIYESGDIITANQIEFDNNVGGTVILEGKFKVKLTSDGGEDYETGITFIGKLFRKSDIEKARKAGTTAFTPENYKHFEKSMYEGIVQAFQNFDPRKVFVSEFDIID